MAFTDGLHTCVIARAGDFAEYRTFKGDADDIHTSQSGSGARTLDLKHFWRPLIGCNCAHEPDISLILKIEPAAKPLAAVGCSLATLDLFQCCVHDILFVVQFVPVEEKSGFGISASAFLEMLSSVNLTFSPFVGRQY